MIIRPWGQIFCLKPHDPETTLMYNLMYNYFANIVQLSSIGYKTVTPQGSHVNIELYSIKSSQSLSLFKQRGQLRCQGVALLFLFIYVEYILKSPRRLLGVIISLILQNAKWNMVYNICALHRYLINNVLTLMSPAVSNIYRTKAGIPTLYMYYYFITKRRYMYVLVLPRKNTPMYQCFTLGRLKNLVCHVWWALKYLALRSTNRN